MALEDVMVKRFVARSRKRKRHTEDDNPDTRLIPGFGGVRQATERKRAQALKRPVPGSYQPGRLGQTKPTPGSYYGRKKPRRD